MRRLKLLILGLSLSAGLFAFAQPHSAMLFRGKSDLRFNILGVKGGTDSLTDAWFANSGDMLNVTWADAPGETAYKVTVLENDGSTQVCGSVDLAADSTTYTYSQSGDCGGALTEGETYKLSISAAKGGSSKQAANGMFNFTVDRVAPTVTITGNPTNPTDQTTATFTWTQSDATSGIASTECLLDTVSQGACSSPVNLTGLADGNHTFEVRVTDNAGNIGTASYTWNVNTIVISGGPNFNAFIGTAWLQAFSVTGGSGTFTWTLPLNPDTASVNTVPEVSFTPAVAGKRAYTIRATDTVSTNIKDHNFFVDVYESGLCLWTGTTSTAWATASNWTNCGGGTPLTTSKIAISGWAPNMPILAATTTVDSFGLGVGGGTLTVNAGRILNLTNGTQTVRSSVAWIGQTDTCTNCSVSRNGNLAVLDSATLRWLSGISVNSGAGTIILGDGFTSGHLSTYASAGSNTFPNLTRSSTPLVGITVAGSSLSRSRIEIDGLRLGWSGANSRDQIRFIDWYTIEKMDRVASMAAYTMFSPNSHVEFSNCTNANIVDINWDNWFFNQGVASGHNIKAGGTNCSSLPIITISNLDSGGPGYGSRYENDPHSRINWANDSGVICTWTGASDNSWTNPSNWGSCMNGRGNFPGHLDEVIVPPTANQPVVSSGQNALRFGVGVGGGTVTINAGSQLRLTGTSLTIRSPIEIRGGTPTCVNCNFEAAHNLSVVDNSTLRLGPGTRVTSSANSLQLGNGISAGHLRTGGYSSTAEWPVIETLVVVRGASGSRSTVDVNGVILFRTGAGSAPSIRFDDWYDIQNFDGVRSGPNYSINGSTVIDFASCTNGVITDTNWTDHFFLSGFQRGVGFNIRVNGTGCSTIGPITVSNPPGMSGGPGYGSIYEADTLVVGGRLNWLNDSEQNCVWNGSASSTWANSANWSNCNNGRGDYPDHLDTVRFPAAVPNSAVVSDNIFVNRIDVGAGGGTLTINANRVLTLHSATSIRSDVTFKGATSTCNNCWVRGTTALGIVDNATVRLESGISVLPQGNTELSVGDGSTPGHLVTNIASTLTTEWPYIGFTTPIVSLVVRGTSNERSSLNINGLRVEHWSSNTAHENALIRIQGHSQIKRFDRVNLIHRNDQKGILFSSCHNLQLDDQDWNQVNFVNSISSGKNVEAVAANCSSMPAVNLTGSLGLGKGASFENDPFNKIKWDAPTFSAPTIFYGSVGVPWTYTFTATGGSGSYSYSLPTNPAGATVNASTGQVDFTPASAGAIDFVVRVTDTTSSETWDHAFSVHSYDSGVCLWTGTTSTAWATASNWEFCGGGTPTTTSKIAIHSTSPNMPILAATTTVDSFGLGVGGGTLTINAGRALTLTSSTASMRSSAAFQGATPGCTNCSVGTVTSQHFRVLDQATLRLGTGIRLGTGGQGFGYFFGNGTTSGHLVTTHASTLTSEWPVFTGSHNTSVIFNGSASDKASISVNGVYFNTAIDPAAMLTFQNGYRITRFDRVRFNSGGGKDTNTDYVAFSTCTDGEVLDPTWSEIEFLEPVAGSAGYNIDAGHASCSGLNAFTVTPAPISGGGAYGDVYENDPHSKISWLNSASNICVWNGSASTSWFDAANWSSCNNGRGGYPDQLDEVVIPPGTPFSPTLSITTTIRRFGLGAGGGTLTINAGRALWMASTLSSVSSSVVARGATSGCTNCSMASLSHFRVNDSATLGAGLGVQFYTGGQNLGFLFGNGTSGGHFVTAHSSTTSSEWPRFGSGHNQYMTFNGSPSDSSSIAANGFQLFTALDPGAQITFNDHYRINQFDRVWLFAEGAKEVNTTYINFANCTNGSVLDTTWSDMNLASPLSGLTGYNVNLSHASCSAFPLITVTPNSPNGGAGYGTPYENDPHGRLSWSNSNTQLCEWNGSTSTVWENPSNWNNCTNSRGNYPDQLDEVIVPPGTPFSPTIGNNTTIRRFGIGAGGGTITINSSRVLWMANTLSSVSSTITFQGATSTCSNCSVQSLNHFRVTDSATLRVGTGIRMYSAGQSWGFYFGNGTTGGNLVTAHASTLTSEWPYFGSGHSQFMVFQGASSDSSTINVSGIGLNTEIDTSSMVTFSDHYRIEGFDNFRFSSGASKDNNTDYVRFLSCNNSTVTDLTWSGLTFLTALSGASGNNLDAGDASCSALPSISVINYSGPGACGNVGAGACALENDPHNKFSWD